MDKKLFRECMVVSVDDDKAGRRIKVRINPEDNECKTIEELPYCFPLIQKHFHIVPKVGEMVLVMLGELGAVKGRRYYIGPFISQDYYLNKDDFNFSARSLLDERNIVAPFPNPNTCPDYRGTYLDIDDVALQGRQNADLVLKNDEVRLRCGFKKDPLAAFPPRTLLFNKEDLSYIQMKYRRRKDQNDKDYSSSINIVADRINLLSHDSKTPFKLNDPEYYITDEEMKKILENAHPLVYGDYLVDFLKQFIEVFKNHTHPMSMDPPSFSSQDTSVLNNEFDEMLSQSVRTN